MTPAVDSMLAKYKCQTERDYVNALKEIMQEIALLGLWRARFFEHAAFYGGTALRILYNLDRFSEDLDFTLLKSNKNFKLTNYLKAIKEELDAMGFGVTVEEKIKASDTGIESAFIKAGTKEHLIKIAVPQSLVDHVQLNEVIKIKLEVDTDPPEKFETEPKTLLLPIPFTVTTVKPTDLFAGKLHAILERDFKTRVKGRDYFDFVWYVSRNVPVHLEHLHEKLKQSGRWSSKNGWDPQKAITKNGLHELMKKKLMEVDFELAQKDVSPFIKDQAALSLWSTQFFIELLSRVEVQ